MRIAWLTDFMPFDLMAGGGGLSDKACIVEGIKEGHSIDVVNSDSLRVCGIGNYDLLIVSNCFKVNFQELAQAINVLPSVFYLHDFFPLCPFHLYFPKHEKCKQCKNLPMTKQMLMSSVLNIFLSPLHFETWSWVLPELKDVPHFSHVSPVDVDLFKKVETLNRIPNRVIGVNSLMNFKGAKNIIEYAQAHSELDFVFVGGMEEGIKLPDNARFIGYVANSTLPELYSQSEYFVHLPSNIEPCGRTVIESKLCGCKQILNENVGAASYPEFSLPIEEFRAWIHDSPKRFWGVIEKT